MGKLFDAVNDKVTISPATLTNIKPVTLDTGKRYSHPQAISLLSGNTLVGWCDNVTGAKFVWACAISANGGVTLGTRVVVGGDGSTADVFDGCFVQLSGGTVVAFYHFNTGLYYRTSTDDGATWASSTEVVAAGGVSAAGHPSAVIKGSTLTVVFVDNTGAIVRKQATVTSSAVGAFGTTGTVVTAATNYDPQIALLPDGELGVVYLVSATAKFIKSSDSGAGSSWASAVSVSAHTTTSDNANPSILVYGSSVWCSFSAGSDQSGTYPSVTPGNRVTLVSCSLDNGATWSSLYPFAMITADDLHRVSWCLVSGSPVAFGAAFTSDTDYHIARAVASADWIANVLSQGATVTNLSTWTAWCWMRVSGVVNAADNSYVLSKNTADRVYIQMKTGVVQAAREIHGFVNRATTASDYKIVGAIVDNTWTFVAVNFDDSRGNGARFGFFVGTTPANLAAVSASVDAEGSGGINDDTRGPVVIGSRNTDTLRVWPGDLGKVGLANTVLTLPQLQNIMRETYTLAVAAAWPLMAGETTLADDEADNGFLGIYSGPVDSSSEPPDFPAATTAPENVRSVITLYR